MKKSIMNQQPTWEDIKEPIAEAIEHIAVLRREALTINVPKETIDEFIASRAKEDFYKFEEMSEERLVIFMIGDIIRRAPEDVLDMLSDELRGEHDA